jgi:hypothetical protein
MAVEDTMAVVVVAIVYALITMVSVAAGATLSVGDTMAVADAVAVVAFVYVLTTRVSEAAGATLAVVAAVAVVAASIRSKDFFKTRNLIFGTNVRKKAAYKIDPWSQSSGLKNLTITW